MEPQPTTKPAPDLIDLSGLYVPLAHCRYLTLGKLDPAVVAELERKGFDHAPVCPTPEVAIGVIPTSAARRLLDSETGLESSHSEMDSARVLLRSSLDSFLELMSTREAVLVVAAPDRPGALGMLTISDLNRHLFRANLYSHLARLEARLAHTVERHFSDPWEWLGKLNEDGQASIVGRWEVLKRRGLDVGPVVAANLAHLLNVVRKSKPLLEQLGFLSGNAFDKATGHIPQIRNSVMHLARPLMIDVNYSCRSATIILAGQSQVFFVLPSMNGPPVWGGARGG